MTAAEIWAKFGGLIDSNDSVLLVDLHKIDDERASRPLKNIRFPYQVMRNDRDQTLPTQFRSLKNARKFFSGEMDYNELKRLLNTGRARSIYGPAN